jgi:hypothetical protein
MWNRPYMIDELVRILFLFLSGLTLVLIAVWYVSFCFQEITGTSRVVIDPLTVVTDEGKGSDELGMTLAQMLQADLESRTRSRSWPSHPRRIRRPPPRKREP